VKVEANFAARAASRRPIRPAARWPFPVRDAKVAAEYLAPYRGLKKIHSLGRIIPDA